MDRFIDRFKGEAALLVTAMFWGYGFVATAIALESFSTYQLLFFRFLIASVFLIIFFFRKVRSIRMDIIRKGALTGSFLFFGFVLQTIGINYTTPSRNAFLTSVNVVIVPIIAYFIFRRRLDLNEVVGAVLSLVGIGILTLELGGAVNIGDLLTLGCAVVFAFQIFYTGLFMKGQDPIEMTIVQIFTCTLLSGAFLLFSGDPAPVIKEGTLQSLFYLGLISTCVSTILQMYGQKYTSETRASIFMSMEALWGTVFSVIFIGEPMTLRLILGGAVIFTAILISEIKPWRRKVLNPDRSI